jgi:hypothetical protein
MSYLTNIRLDSDRCWVCGYKKVTESEIKLSPRICYWCSEEQVMGLIDDIVMEAKECLSRGKLGECEDIDVLSFVADIGELGARHPYLKQFSRMMSIIAVQVALEHRYTPDKLVKVANGESVSEKWARAHECIAFLVDVGLLELGGGKYIYERYRPSDLLLALTASVEAVDVEGRLPPRVAACIAGHAWLHGISATIKWLKEGAQGEAKGIAKLYAKSKDGKLSIPKSFTAPTIYLLGHLAGGHSEFSEVELRTWLSFRGISGSDADFIVNLLARVVPSNHRLTNLVYDGRACHFKLNSSYIRMRERYRERRRSAA